MNSAMLKAALAVCLATCTGPALAQPPSAHSDNPNRFDQLDRNRDGFLSRDETKDAEELQTRFSELDRNNDNKLSREEYDVIKADRTAATGASAPAEKPPSTPGAKGKTR